MCMKNPESLDSSCLSRQDLCGDEQVHSEEAVPLVCYVLVCGVILYLAYAVFIGDPPWPSVIVEEEC